MPYEKLNDQNISDAVGLARQINAVPPKMRGQSVSAAPTSMSEDLGRIIGQTVAAAPEWLRAGSDPNKIESAVTFGAQMLPPLAAEQALTDVERGNYGSAAANTVGLLPLGKMAAPAIVKAMAMMPAKKPANLGSFLDLASTGKIHQAKTPKEDLKSILAKDVPATSFDIRNDHPLSYDYETGKLTEKLRKSGLYVEDNGMGSIRAGTTPEALDLIKNAETPLEFGKAYGYSDSDIANFYLKRRGGNAELANEDYVNDLSKFNEKHNSAPAVVGNANPGEEVLRLRAQEMELPRAQRTQPSGYQVFETTPTAYKRTEGIVPQQSFMDRLPRPIVGKALPLNERMLPILDIADEVAAQYASKMAPYQGKNVEYFYHTGPVYEKSFDLLGDEGAGRAFMDRFSKTYAGTSPRTPTEQNLLNSSLLSYRVAEGLPIEKPVLNITGNNDVGYPMISGMHPDLTRRLLAGEDTFANNPKPSSFAENVRGNLQGVTADTHNIRGILRSYEDLRPGSLPREWFKTDADYDQYLRGGLTPDILSGGINDGLASQTVNKISRQSEYGPMADITARSAEILGEAPAPTQSLGWFGLGDMTNLRSAPKTLTELMGERIDVTAQKLGIDPEETARLYMQGKIPLMNQGGRVGDDADIEAAMHMARQNFDNGGSAFPLSISGGGSLAPIDDEFVQGYGGGAGGRFGLKIPVRGGMLDTGVSGSVSGYDMDTPEGRKRDIEGDIGGGDISYSRDGRTYGASYSEQPNSRGDTDRTIMINYSMPFAGGGRVHKEGGGVAINQDQIDQGIIAANQSLQELRGAKQAVRDEAASNQSWGDWASQMGKNLYGMKDIGLFHDIVPGAIQSVKQAATMPYRQQMAAASGQPWNEQQQIGEAFNTAGMFTLGAGAIPAEANALRAGAGMYSKAERAALGLPMEKMQGPQALAMLGKAGIGTEELQWTGLADRLSQTPQLTKQQLVDMIRQNDVQLNEVIRGGTKPNTWEKVRPTETASAPFMDDWNSVNEKIRTSEEKLNAARNAGQPYATRDAENELNMLYSTRNNLHERMVEATIDEMGGLGKQTKFGPDQNPDWSLRGGKNYQETVITTPETRKTFDLWPVLDKNKHSRGSYASKEEAEIAAQKINGTVGEKTNQEVLSGFSNQHWPEKNVIAHIRTNQFDAIENGKYFTPAPVKAFNLDELQSDWAHKGRKKGFADPDFNEKVNEIQKIITTAEHQAYPYIYKGKPVPKKIASTLSQAKEQLLALQTKENAVPIAPYVQSTNQWVDLGLKKAMSQAIDSGSDVFTWVPGNVAADRFDLSKQIAEVRYDHMNNDLYAYDHNGRQVINQYTEPQQLDEYIGKELAEKVRNEIKVKQSTFDEYGVEKDPETGRWYPHLYGEQMHEYGGNPVEFRSKYDAEQYIKDMIEQDTEYQNVQLSGLDLKVGGEGMKDFYNNIVPKRLSEVIRKATGEKPQFQTWTIQTADGPLEVQGFRFTPEMKAKLQALKEKEGGYFPHFANGGKVDDNSVNKALRIAAEASV